MEEIIIKEFTKQKFSRSEKLKLEMWLKECSKNRKIYAQMQLVMQHPDSAKRGQIQEEVWNNIKGRNKSHTINTRKKRGWDTWQKAAAILIFCFSLALVVYQFNHSIRESNSNLVEVKVIEKVSLPGQKVTTKLPDGTMVELNSESKIVVPDSFKDDIREITLEGEAFFKVARDESRPFIINTKDLRVEVLGTSFNIKSYPGENISVVAVASGKVAVSDDRDSRENLLKGEKVAYTSKTKLMFKEDYNWEEEFGWKENILLFQNNNLSEIMERLTRWYGVEFNIENNTLDLDKNFSGRYNDPSLRTVLKGLSFVYNFNYQIKGKAVTLK